jgi:hypothetical protein
MRQNILIAILLLLMTAAAAWWLQPYIIVKDKDKRHPPKQSVTANPFSALESLLQSQGIAAISDNNRELLSGEFSATDALFLRNVRQPLSQKTTDHIISWVESGGLLIYEPYFFEEQQGSYLNEAFGVFLKENSAEEYNWFIHAEAILDGQIAYVHMDGDYILESSQSSANPIITSEYGVHGYQVFYGQGEVIVLADTRFMETPNDWRNFRSILTGDARADQHTLTGHDHAYLSYRFFEGREKAWLIHDTKTTGLMDKLIEKFPLFTLFTTCWLILFFFYLQRRLGPQQSSEAGLQQDISTHIHQAGQFFWQQDKGQYLLQQYRQRVLKKLTTRHPNLAGLDQDDLLQQIAKSSQLDIRKIELALRQTTFNKQDFTLAVNTLRQLWIL